MERCLKNELDFEIKSLFLATMAFFSEIFLLGKYPLLTVKKHVSC